MCARSDNDRQAHSPRRLLDHPILGPLPPAATVHFILDGMPVAGRAGEPIVAALLATGIRVFRTMPRFGEARGGYCLVGRCSDCLITVDGITNVRACLEPVREGASVVTQRGIGSWSSALDGSVGSEPMDRPA
ncbi:MAG: (2Fe-2S)-binding protein [Chloroflexota bacterium]|nr:(2Fe-2S)-binding protein [Chloroflexota bacterium]